MDEAPLREPLDETLAYLASDEAEASIEADPYWPKWDAPWWRMILLHEMGLARRIPARAIETLVRVLPAHCLHTFPFRIEEVPPGIDPVRQIACHCQLGTGYSMLSAAGVDVDAALPWIRPWFLRYQLPDGGLNCDEAAYTRPAPRSSIVSTLPPLEAVLFHTPRPFTAAEEGFVDRGAAYILERRLWRSVSRGGAPMDERFAQLCFPRFYLYDLLRGLAWLARWAEARDRSLPREAVREAVDLIERQVHDGALAPARRAIEGVTTLRRAPDGTWRRGEPASTFPLLDAVSAPGVPSPYLARAWAELAPRLGRVAPPDA